MASSQPLSLGALTPWSTQGDYNAHLFVIEQAISKLQTATLVRIDAVTNDGGVSPVGTVDVTPLVGMIDGFGKITPHVTVFGLPYLRIQGGANAVIIDPQVGDIGVAVFASRDISQIKATRKQGGPGSGRSYDWSDGIYLSTVLSASAPTQYIQFNADGISVVSPSGQITLTADSIQAGSSPTPVVTEAFIAEWINGLLRPALAAHGIVVAAPASDALTTTFEAS